MLARHHLFLLLLLCLALLRVLQWHGSTAWPDHCELNQEVELQGSINSATYRPAQRLILDVTVARINTPGGCQALVDHRIRLSWYRFTEVDSSEPIGPASKLVATVRLRPPWGSRNPGAFDYQRWLLGQGYMATGYVRHGSITTVQSESGLDLSRYVFAELLQALISGDQSGISSSQWALFRATGTVHLMVISGLHVGVFSGFAYLICFSMLRLLPLVSVYTTSMTLALWAAAFSTLLFALASGADPPVMRAASMSVMAIVLFSTLRANGNWLRALLVIGLLTLIVAPNFVFQQGFWLSYLAVAVLVSGFAFRRRRSSAVRGLCYCQLLLFFLFTPWVGFLVGEAPVISLLANLLVVPVITLFTIPVALTGRLLASLVQLSSWLFTAADFSLAMVMQLLQWLQGLAFPLLGPFGLFKTVVAAVAAWLLTMPLSGRVKLLCLLGWIPLWLPNPKHIAPGEFVVTVLDVGQGSAAIVDTQHHRLLVDAGVRFADGFDAGQAIVLPALRATGPNRLNGLLISHLDADHAGGVPAIISAFPEITPLGLDGSCPAVQWQWDGVGMRVLSYAGGVSRNDRSCTLLISGVSGVAYLSGDISAVAERALLPGLPRDVDLLVAPHHGSATSSSAALVNQLAPRVVVFSAGRFNRYQHPRADVVARYKQAGAKIYITGHSGALRWSSQHPEWIRSARNSPD